ncbi:MAG TPA: PQQ-binding-like beta-propeller repeat protein, partial [Planctomycetia bacterium]|nr:PQQ-binding-like beta-propeller repeat protein [Planctomycetia bacterium]
MATDWIATLILAALSGEPAAGAKAAPKDWPMMGGTVHRNMVNPTAPISLEFSPGVSDEAPQKNLVWSQKIGSQTYGSPVVAGGRIFIGTNNGGERLPEHKGDKGCVLAFDEKTGELLWQLTRDKLPQGEVNDWPEQGISSTCCVDGDRLYVVTNRAEVVCLDVKGFADGNQGAQDEQHKGAKDADVLWSFDMIGKLEVFPVNLASSSPVVYGDGVFVVTSNGVDGTKFNIPKPNAPSFLCLDKNTGAVVWKSNFPSRHERKTMDDSILQGQWSSPTIGLVVGKPQVYMPGGDGVVYAFEPKSGELLWQFQLN